jgi:hypothetical protein
MDATLTLPDEVLDQVIDRVVERLASSTTPTSPWLDTQGAAEYLGWPVQRIYKHIHELPHYRHVQRLMFRRDELDSWLEGHREARVRV